MWGLPLLRRYVLAATAIDWLMSPAVHSAGLVMWDIGFLLAAPALSSCALAVVSQVPSRHVRLPSIWFWMTLKDTRWRGAGVTVTKFSRSLKWCRYYESLKVLN